jgi:hypothetical protein
MARQGYAPMLQAFAWLGKHRKTDVSRQLGGAMTPGIHTATCIEYISNGSYTDYIFQSTEGNFHKERVWSKEGPPLGSIWKFELHYAGDGICHIERGGSDYYLIDERDGSVLKVSEKIRDIYAFLNESKLKLKYLKMKWKTRLDKAKEETLENK